MQPEKVKYRKMHRGSRTGLALSGNTVAFGEFGLMALERCWMDGKQLEACRVAITRYMKRKGKAPLEGWVAVIRPANILFEVDGITEAEARESMRLAATKLPIKTKFISRHHRAS